MTLTQMKAKLEDRTNQLDELHSLRDAIKYSNISDYSKDNLIKTIDSEIDVVSEFVAELAMEIEMIKGGL